ncbi:hypothetical protein Tco_0223297 [Tanacetum coccineum]
MSTLTFADTHNMVAFLEKPAESDGFHKIIDFLNANQIRYALTVNPTIYTSCIEQFWATVKTKTVNGERQLQALVDKKKVIITETSIRSDLYLEDAGGTDCLPTATLFEELARMGYEKPSQKLTFYKAFFSPQWKFLIHTITQCLSAKSTAWNEFSSIMASLGDMSHHKKIYVNPSHTKKIFANMKIEGKDFSGRITHLFAIMMVQANQEEGVDSGIPTDSQQIPITTQPSSSRSLKKHSRRKQRKETKVPQDETQHDDNVPTPSNDPPLSGEDRMQLTELMNLCTNLQKQVLDLEKAKDAQAKEIVGLKKRVQKLERKKEIKNYMVKKIKERRPDDAEMFDTDDLHSDEVIVDMVVVTTAGEGVTATKIDEITTTSAPIIAIDEITLAQTLIEIKAAKPKAVTTVATTTTTTRPQARGVVVQEPIEFRTTTSSPQASQPSKTKDKGKAIMIEPEVSLKKKDQVALDEEIARKKEEEANITLIESWENTQAMMEPDRLLAE